MSIKKKMSVEYIPRADDPMLLLPIFFLFLTLLYIKYFQAAPDTNINIRWTIL